jgi:hypothetical protein
MSDPNTLSTLLHVDQKTGGGRRHGLVSEGLLTVLTPRRREPKAVYRQYPLLAESRGSTVKSRSFA